jgi:hypothetical protein
MGKIIIRCANCGRDWPEETIKNGHGTCQCGKTYCAKRRNWDYVEED